jgi:hypothetical protein
MKEYMAWVNTEGIKYKSAPDQPNYLELSRRRDDSKETGTTSADGATAVEGSDGKKSGFNKKDRKDKKGGARSTYTHISRVSPC